MKCPRCSGLMVPHRYSDLEGVTVAGSYEAWRCVNCGELVDAVVLEHRSGGATQGQKTTRRWARTLAA